MGAHRKVSDGQITGAIASLFGQGAARWPSVVEVADRLRRDHGHQGTHDRIRAMLAAAKRAEVEGEASAGEGSEDWQRRTLELHYEFTKWREEANRRIHALETELAVTRERAELAEARDDSSTQRWLMEVDRNRQLSQELESTRVPGVPHDQYLEVYRDLQAARQELATLRGAATIVKNEK